MGYKFILHEKKETKFLLTNYLENFQVMCKKLPFNRYNRQYVTLCCFIFKNKIEKNPFTKFIRAT